MTREVQIFSAADSFLELAQSRMQVGETEEEIRAFELGFNKGVEWAATHHSWTLRRDALPPVGESIIIATTKTIGEGCFSIRNGEENWRTYRWSTRPKPEEVIAWMVLPKFNG